MLLAQVNLQKPIAPRRMYVPVIPNIQSSRMQTDDGSTAIEVSSGPPAEAPFQTFSTVLQVRGELTCVHAIEWVRCGEGSSFAGAREVFLATKLAGANTVTIKSLGARRRKDFSPDAAARHRVTTKPQRLIPIFGHGRFSVFKFLSSCGLFYHVCIAQTAFLWGVWGRAQTQENMA